jgi:hydroxymethylpyrimidine/phosphomethylpyrimidine kinase
MATPPPVALTIAGSDNSAGAGAQADLKTMTALGVYALTAITCVVAEVPGRVSSIQPVDPKIVTEQIRLSFEAFPIAAVKTGMLHSRPIMDEICDLLNLIQRGRPRRVPLVVDPVMVASSGDSLLHADAVAVYRERLIPMATLVTPNLDETAVLLGRPIRNLAELQAAGEELVQRYGASFLLKGGHLIHEARATDLLFLVDGARHTFAAPFTNGVSTHGTGCTMSAAIASYLARGLPIAESVERAKLYVSKAIRKFHRWSAGRVVTDALNHGA